MGTTLLIYAFVLYQHSSGAKNDNSSNARLQRTLGHFCSPENFIQCPDNVSRNVVSQCCTGCSCEPTCGLTGSCCFEKDDRYHLIESGDMVCMYPDTKLVHGLGDNPMFKFVVGPPQDGCLGTGSCNKSDKLIPWRTFYPIFSREKGINYINEECAKCHGVTDGLKWTSRFSLTYIESIDVPEIIQFLQKYKSNDAFAYFIHPGNYSEMISTICSDDVEDTCIVEKALIDLPPNLLPTGLSYNDIKYGCLFGPYLPFPNYPIFYKNAFCAICDTFQARNEKCRANIDRVNNIAFTSVIDNTFVSKIAENRESMEGEKACKVRTNDGCRETLCPAMQARDDHGKCVFPTENWILQYASVYIIVTFPDLSYDNSILPNKSKKGLLDVFYEKSPWNSCWHLYYIGIRSYEVDGRTLTEFILRLVCRKSRVNPKLFVAEIKDSHSKNWIIHLDEKSYRGYQVFSRYQMYQRETTGESTFLPLWDKTTGSMLIKTCAFVFNLTTPNWKVLYQNPTYVRFFIIVTKMFYCKRVLLTESEYYIDDHCYMVKLNGSENILFQFEIQMSRLDSTRISVCLEDAGMRIVSNGDVGILCFSKKLDKYGLVVLLVLTKLRWFLTQN